MTVTELEASIKRLDDDHGPAFHPKQDVGHAMLRASLEIAYQLAIHNAREFGGKLFISDNGDDKKKVDDENEVEKGDGR